MFMQIGRSFVIWLKDGRRIDIKKQSVDQYSITKYTDDAQDGPSIDCHCCYLGKTLSEIVADHRAS